MAITAADLQVKISTQGAAGVKRDLAGLGRTVDDTGKKSRNLFNIFAGTAGGFLAATAFTNLASGFKGMVGDFVWGASNLAESQQMVNVVFGDSVGVVNDWAQNAANAFGISEQAALATIGVFGNLFTNMGFTQEAAADMGTSFVGLSADMSSFFNVSQPQVIEAMTSAFVGEYDALQRLGVNINAAQVEQYALNQGIWDGNGALTDQQRALAVSGILWDQTKNAQGDVARTSDSLANQTRILRANMENLSATIGQALIPVATKLTGWGIGAIAMFRRIATAPKPFHAAMGELHTLLTKAFGKNVATGIVEFVYDMVDGFKEFVDIVKDVGDAIADIGGDALEDVFGFLVDHGEMVKTVLQGIAIGLGVVAAASIAASIATGTLAAVMAVLFSPITLIVAAIAALYVAYQTNFLGFADGVRAAIEFLTPAFEALVEAFNAVKAAFQDGGWTAALATALNIIESVIDAIVARFPALGPIFDGVATAVRAVFNAITDLVGMAIDFATHETTIATFRAVWEGLTTAIGFVVDAISAVVGFVIDFATHETTINTVKAVWEGLTTAIATVVGAIAEVVGYVIDFATHETTINTFKAVWEGLETAIDAVQGAINAVSKYIFDFFEAEATVEAFKAVWDGLKGAIDGITGAINAVVGMTPDFSSIISAINTLLAPIQAVIDAWNSLPFIGGGNGGGPPGSAGQDPTVPGGYIPGGGGGGGGGFEKDKFAPGRGGFNIAGFDAAIGKLRDVGSAATEAASNFDTLGIAVSTSASSFDKMRIAVGLTMSATQTAVTGGMATITAAMANGASTAVTATVSLFAPLPGLIGGVMTRAQVIVSSGMSAIVAAMANGGALATSSLANAIAPIPGIIEGTATRARFAAVTGGNGIAEGFRSGTSRAPSLVSAALSGIPGIVAAAGSRAAGSAFGAGANISSSFAAGMRSQLGSIIAAGNAMVAAAQRAVVARAMIASPSRLFWGLGEEVPAGFAGGITSGYRDVMRATAGMVGIPALAPAGAGFGGAYPGGIGTVNITINQQPGEDGEALSRRVVAELRQGFAQARGPR